MGAIEEGREGAGQEPINVADYERLASEVLDAGPHGYFAGGAGDEWTLRENVEAFRRWRLRPRVLVDVAEVSTATTALGRDVSMPGHCRPGRLPAAGAPEDGEAGMARAAAAAGTIMCLSTLATARPSEVAAAAPGARSLVPALLLPRPRDHRCAARGGRGVGVRGDRAHRRRPDARDAGSATCGAASRSLPELGAEPGGDRLRTGLRRSPRCWGWSIPPLTWGDLEALTGRAGCPCWSRAC